MKTKLKRLTYLLALLIAVSTVFPGCTKKPVNPEVVVLITIDTLRRDHLGCYGYSRDTSPFIDQLAKDGVMFKNVVTPLPLTDAAHASILTGLHPLVHGLLQNATKLSGKVETIAEVMKKNGFYTMGAIAVHHLTRGYNFSQGFDSYSDKWDKSVKHNLVYLRVAESVNQSVFKQIKEYKEKHSKEKLFIWVHYYDPHVPYIDWKDVNFSKGKNPGSPGANPIEKNVSIYNYDKEIRYTDRAVKNLLGFLEQQGLSEKMVVCITADHGEQLGEHGVFGAHHDIYAETVMVPLIFSGYGIPKNKVSNHYVSSMDIAPTLLQLLDLSFQSPVQGMPLLDEDREPKKPSAGPRDFMVVGNPRLTRSVELIKNPFSYILNFDYLYKDWYLSLKSAYKPGVQADDKLGVQADDSGISEELLTPVKQGAISIKYFKKSNKYEVAIDYPRTLRRGLHMGVLRFDIEKNSGLAVCYEVGSGEKARYIVSDKSATTVTAFFPITPLDGLRALVYKKAETKLKNFRYAVLPAKEAASYLLPEMRQSNRIFKTLLTPRKKRPGDQWFNLQIDPRMRKNLLKKGEKLLLQVVKAKKEIYRRLGIYQKENKHIHGKAKRKKALTEKEKEMLKSLGYL